MNLGPIGEILNLEEGLRYLADAKNLCKELQLWASAMPRR